jgi:RecG-like helicase
MLTARVTDGSATVSATWFNQPWLERQLQQGTSVRLRGRQGRYGFDVRSFDIGDGEATADFAPVYPASEEITAKKLRELVGAALPKSLPDPLPSCSCSRSGSRAAGANGRRRSHPPSARRASWSHATATSCPSA